MTSILVALALLIGLILALIGFAPDALSDESNRMSLVYFLCWLVLAGGAIFATFRNNWAEAARSALIWVVVLLALVAGYSVRDDLADFGQGTLAALVPGLAVNERAGTVSLRRATDGHFYVWARAENEDVRFVVDTGASMVVLRHEDARQLGMDPADLAFTMPVSTANGATTAAPIQLAELAIGDIALRDVEAAVMRPGLLETSLLGLTYLGRLSAYSFEGDTLSMRR